MSTNKRPSDRRALRFNGLDEVLRDVDRLIAAERAGTLRRTGNWSLGKTLGHLAFWIDAPFDGYPPGLRANWLLQKIFRLFRKKFCFGSLPAGIRLPRTPEGTFGVEEMDSATGRARLAAAIQRLERSAPTLPNSAMGHLSHEEWIGLTLRHAELHLSFQHES